MILNATQDTNISNVNDFLALFDSNTPIDLITSSDIADKTIYIKDSNLTFDSNGTFVMQFAEYNETRTLTGTWDINNSKVIVINMDNNDTNAVKTMYSIMYDNKTKMFFLGVDANNSIKTGIVKELN
jgi:hypothetical protein